METENQENTNPNADQSSAKKRTFTIEIYGSGGETVIGRLTKEQGEYWIDRPTQDLDQHLDAFHDADESVKPVPEVSHLEDWSEIDSVCHIYGIELDANPKVTVSNAHGDTVFEFPIYGNDELLDSPEVPLFDTYDITRYETEDNDTRDYFFFGHTFEKGLGMSGEIETETFDINKIGIKVVAIDDLRFIEDVVYDGEELYLEKEGSETKGTEFAVFEGRVRKYGSV